MPEARLHVYVQYLFCIVLQLLFVFVFNKKFMPLRQSCKVARMYSIYFVLSCNWFRNVDCKCTVYDVIIITYCVSTILYFVMIGLP